MSNWLDNLVAAISPEWGLRRLSARNSLALYEAATPSRNRQFKRATESAGASVRAAASSLRDQARWMEQNHDLFRSMLDRLVATTIGPYGIMVEPMPIKGEDLLVDLAATQRKIWRAWCERPDVQRERTWAECEALLARTAFRDGEAFLRWITDPSCEHPTSIPLSIELLEPDFFPLGMDGGFSSNAQDALIRDSMEMTKWGRVTNWHALRQHPLDIGISYFEARIRIPAEDIIRLPGSEDRIHARRSASIFASLMERMADLREYERAEQMAAKIAATLTAFVRKGDPMMYQPPRSAAEEDDDREIQLRPGLVIADLEAGEDIGVVGQNGRPNPNMTQHRLNLLRAAASSVGVSADAISQVYDGNYSARRQGRIDSDLSAAMKSRRFVERVTRSVYRRVQAMAIATGQYKLPKGVSLTDAFQATYIIPKLPWVDLAKETEAWLSLVGQNVASPSELVLQRGRSPIDVTREIAHWAQLGKRFNVAPPINPDQPLPTSPKSNEPRRS